MTEHKEFNWLECQADKFVTAILYPPVFIILLLTLLGSIGVKLYFTKQEIISLIEATCK